MSKNSAITSGRKTVGGQWFASICSRIKFINGLIGNRFEMPNVSYTNPLSSMHLARCEI